MQSSLAALLIPVAFILLTDYRFITSLGNHPTPDIIKYSLTDISIFISYVQSEMTVGVFLALLLTAIISIYLAYQAWYNKTTPKKVLLNSLFVTTSIIFLATVSVSTCQLIKASPLQEQILKTPLILLLQSPFCSETHAQKTNPENSVILTNNRQINLLRNLSSSEPLTIGNTNRTHQKNIVIIVLESFRIDQITPYNPELLTTPFLSEIAKQGLIVDSAYADYPYSSKSLVAIHCGIPPNPTNHITESYSDGINHPCLPELLEPLGYNSAFFQSATQTFENRAGLVNNMGFDHFTPMENLNPSKWHRVEQIGIEERSMLAPTMDWVDQQDSPFLLTIFTVTGHKSWNRLPPEFSSAQMSNIPNINNYYNILRYIDTFLSDLFTEFSERKLTDDTTFIFVSDHGNHYNTDRHWSEPQDTTTHVPLLIWDKELITRPKTVTGLRQHTDILPTIIDLLNFKITSGQTYGTSLLNKSPNKNVHFVCKYNSCLGRIDKNYRFIYRYNDTNPELYDLNNDPTNRHDIISELPENTIKKYVAEVKSWKKAVEALY